MQSSRRLPMLGISIVALGLLTGLAGCGGRTLHQVRGTVAFKDGSDVGVLEGGRVLFETADPEEVVKMSARGDIQKDGTFVMSTFNPGDGVAPGKYKVLVAPPPFFPKARGQVAPRLIDEKFLEFATSGLEITVEGPVFDFSVTVNKP